METFGVATAATATTAIGATGILVATGASKAYTGFTITYYGTLATRAATGLETTTTFFCAANNFSVFCCKTFS